MEIKNIVVFASGNGSNFEAIAQAIIEKKLKANIGYLVCNNPSAFVIERAKKFNIPTLIINRKDFISKEEYELFILKKIANLKIELIVLAGYMLIIGNILLAHFPNKIINIHPSILPAFKGKDAIKQAFTAGVKFTGVTTHYVDSGIDTGKIIEQRRVEITSNINLKELEEKIHNVEHSLYIYTLQKLLIKN